MNAENDKQTELQKVLALKRHEAPPPRFFKGFSDKVIDRLHVPEPPVDRPLWERLAGEFSSRPVLITISAVVVCGCLVIGIVASVRVEPPKPAPRAASDTTHLVVAPAPNASADSVPQLNPASEQKQLPRIGDPAVVSEPSAFDQLRVQPVSRSAASQSHSNRNDRSRGN